MAHFVTSKLSGSESHQNFAVQAEDNEEKGEADFRRARSDDRLLPVVPGRANTSAAF